MTTTIDKGKAVGIRVGRRGLPSLRVALSAFPEEIRLMPHLATHDAVIAAAGLPRAEVGHVIGWAPIYEFDVDAHLVATPDDPVLRKVARVLTEAPLPDEVASAATAKPEAVVRLVQVAAIVGEVLHEQGGRGEALHGLIRQAIAEVWRSAK